jgi:hypothetical protein
MDYLTTQKIESLLTDAFISKDLFLMKQVCNDYKVLIESFGVTLKVYLTITKGKYGLDNGCRRFLNLECDNYSQMRVIMESPEIVKETVDEVFGDWSREEMVEVDHSQTEVEFDKIFFCLNDSPELVTH